MDQPIGYVLLSVQLGLPSEACAAQQSGALLSESANMRLFEVALTENHPIMAESSSQNRAMCPGSGQMRRVGLIGRSLCKIVGSFLSDVKARPASSEARVAPATYFRFVRESRRRITERELPLRVEGGQSPNAQRLSQKGGERALWCRLGKDRSGRQSRRSIGSTK